MKAHVARVLLLSCGLIGTQWVSAYAQVSPEEHARHHPGQAGQGRGMAGPPEGVGGGPPEGAGGMMGGGMMGGMGDMMEEMGAPKPKEMYPQLMDLPDLPMEKRAEIQQEAHRRMTAGANLLSEGVDELSRSAPTDDFAAMQAATAKMREGLGQFESGLAAHRAIAEGKAPRNVALQWFKREMHLLPPSGRGQSGLRLWGMDLFHTAIMLVLVFFAAGMIWMYFFKMRRAALLLRDLTGGDAASQTGLASTVQQGRGALPVAEQAHAEASALQSGRKWSGTLRVSRVFQETPDVKTFRFMNPVGGALPFSYLPGQFLTVAVPVDGKPVKRSYTISSSPTQQDFAEITVKHADQGAVSSYLHDRVKSDDLLELSGPSGSFTFTGRECNCILLIGAGVGITPLMSVLRYLTDRSWPGDIYLLYGCSTPQDIVFRQELDYLQRRHPNLHVVITISRPEGSDWKGPTGRITKELIVQSVPDLGSRYVHVCGPVPMMESVKKLLADLGVPKERIKTEAFGPALGKPEPTRTKPAPKWGVGAAEQAAQAALPTVKFSLSDKSAPLPPDETILDAADQVGVDIDNSCRVGTCGTCRVKLLSGSVTMEVEDGLEPGDKEQGMILACQAKSTSDVSVEV
ncbi:MAG: oxidoreductase [Planctomycetaceae bacterium]|nr:oxidoreductase [Planctomycetaceae bacterium]